MENMVDLNKTTDVENIDIEYIHSKAKSEFEKLSNHTFFITGAGGFLGYYFIKSIISWNDKYPDKSIYVTGLSNFKSGIPTWIANLKERKDFKLIKKDIAKFKISKSLHFDYIIHAASIASPTFYRLFPIETINANVQGLYNILNYLVDRRNTKNFVKGLLYFSSSEIYGDPLKGNIPTSEDYRGNVSCTGPRACYDESKRFCETLCVNYSKVYNLPIKSARPFNNYGPGLQLKDKRVIPDISKNILEGKDIELYSNGSPSRTFCYVADAIVGYLKILIHGRDGEAYNIGTEKQEITIDQLASKIVNISETLFGYKGKIRFKESEDKNYLTDNPQRRCPSINKAKKELGYFPEINLDEGLRRTLLWYKGTTN